MKIDVCICTFRRPSVVQTLESIERAVLPNEVDLEVLVVDNDEKPSARERTTTAAENMSIPVRYLHVSGANISIARNACLENTQAEWLAFLDDDETVEVNWLLELLKRQKETGADAVFGHSVADYEPDAPEWIQAGDFHSQFAQVRGGVVETGHTCNALVRWTNTPWQGERFDLERGRSGGEDTAFFFRLRDHGAHFAIADRALVHEPVSEERMKLAWLTKRRFRVGQSYAASAVSLSQRVVLFGSAFFKSAYCFICAVLTSFTHRGPYWLLRGI
ncbi:MAG: glycosyltransferase family 2 protein, partial [Pseudomonadota bacterium]